MHTLGLRPAVLLHALLFCSSCCASADRAFMWTFTDTSKTNDDFNTLIECDVMNINISSLTNVSAAAAGKAPYYLSAFESGGLVTTTELYMDSQWLRWQVNHKAGSELVLSMFDAEGNSGGVLDTIFTVAGGKSQSCLAPSPAPLSPPTIVPNITDTLGTCQTWGLYVSGGSPPYTISMVVAGSTAITNYTVPQGVGLFSYINTSLPDKRVLAAISDSRGAYGKSTQIVNIKHLDNTYCGGFMQPANDVELLSVDSNSNGLGNRAIIIIAVCSSVGGLLFIAGMVFLLITCRSRRSRGVIDGQDTIPRAFSFSPPSDTLSSSLPPSLRKSTLFPVLDISSRNNSLSSSSLMTLSPAAKFRPQISPFPYDPSHVVAQRPSNSSMRPSQDNHPRYPPSREVIQRPSNSSLQASQENRPHLPPSRDETHVTIAQSPMSRNPPHRNPSCNPRRRAVKQQLHTSRSMGELRGATEVPRHNVGHRSEKRHIHIYHSTGDIRKAASTSRYQAQRRLSRSMSADSRPTNHLRNIMSMIALDPDVEPDIIIQHRDGGVVQELPPPYRDRVGVQSIR